MNIPKQVGALRELEELNLRDNKLVMGEVARNPYLRLGHRKFTRKSLARCDLRPAR